jgi:hypothetical protein
VGRHCCSWARGAVTGRGRSALPSAAGVGPYLDPTPRCDVFLLVGGVIAQLVASKTKGRSGRQVLPVVAVVEVLADPAVFGGQDRERAAVVLGDGAWAWGGHRGGARPDVMRHACPRPRGVPY